MKILTGALRGRAIPFVPNPKLRPTSDRTRKAVFDALQGALEGKCALDLFSGTGALGFEALSQGAARVTFVEKNRAQCDKIKTGVGRLGLEERSEVVVGDALEAIGRFAREGAVFDFIFMDPPYEKGLAARALEAIGRGSLLDAGGWVVLECGRRDELPAETGALKRMKARAYGDTKILFYRKNMDGG